LAPLNAGQGWCCTTPEAVELSFQGLYLAPVFLLPA
jgi:hypothetical protein